MSTKYKPGLSRRSFLKASGLAATPFVAQFLPHLGASSAFAQSVELQWWSDLDAQKDEYPALEQEWAESHPGTTIAHHLYSMAEYLPALETAIAAGTGPDIFFPHVHAVEYGLAGQTIDLNAALGEDFLKQFFPSTRRQFTKDGKQYAVAWEAQTLGFFYNPALFEQVGATTPPETWDELIEIAGELKAAGIVPWTFNESEGWLGCDFVLPLITQATDDTELVYKLDDHTEPGISWNSEPVPMAFQLIEKLVAAEVFQEGMVGTDWATSTANLYGGRAAMMYAGSWVPPDIAQNAPPEFADSYGVFKMPAWASGKPHWCGDQAGADWAIYAHGHVDESVEFIKWLYEPERYARTMNNSLGMPATDAAAAQVTNPIVKEMASWLPDGVAHILFGAGSWDALSAATQGVFAQTLSPEDAAAQTESDLVAIRSRN